jgi:hypothetical protein
MSEVIEDFGHLPERAGMSREGIAWEVMALLLLGSAARRPDGAGGVDTRFRPKIHQIVRSLAPLSVCLNPACGRLLTDGATECACPAETGRPAAASEGGNPAPSRARALILGLCRSCGADYRLGYFALTEEMRRTAQGKLRPRNRLGLQHVGAVFLDPEEGEADQLEPIFFYPGPRADLILEGEDDPPVSGMDYVVCPGCLQAQPAPEGNAVCQNITCDRLGREPLPRFFAFLRGSQCPVCQAQGKGARPSDHHATAERRRAVDRGAGSESLPPSGRGHQRQGK